MDSTEVGVVLICHGHDVGDQAGADGLVAVAEGEALALLQHHGLPEGQDQGGVLARHHHLLHTPPQDAGDRIRRDLLLI